MRQLAAGDVQRNVISMFDKQTPEQMVASVEHLVSLPDVYVQLDKTLKDPNHIIEDIVKIVSIDPAMCVRVLKVVNSSYYALPNPVSSISVAVNLIGERELHDMVMLASVVNSMSLLTDKKLDIVGFWRHSIRCGITARNLARFQSRTGTEVLFLGGLLHDLGKLIIYKLRNKQYEEVEWLIESKKEQRYLAEQALLGYDHAILGALLTETWGLPDQLNEIIKFHHQPNLSLRFKQEAKLINIADQLAYYVEWKKEEPSLDLEALPLEVYDYIIDMKIEIDDLVNLLTNVKEQSQAIENSLYG